MIATFNPEAELLASNKYNLPKPVRIGEAVQPIVGVNSLLSMNGGEWKTWHSRFNPGFSPTNLTGHIPYIVNRVKVLCDKLREHAGRDIFSLDDFATRLTFEVIVKVCL